MSILFSCVFSVIIAPPGNERSSSGCVQGIKKSLPSLSGLPVAVFGNKPTALKSQSQQLHLSLLDLPPEVMPRILDYMRVPLVWQSVHYPFVRGVLDTPFARLPNASRALRECAQIQMAEAERKFAEADESLFNQASWQPSQSLHSIPRTPDEARDVGVWMWCSLRLKMDAVRKLSQILQESVRLLDDLSLDGIGAKPHPKRLNLFLAQLDFQAIECRGDSLHILYRAINNNPELISIVNNALEALFKISMFESNRDGGKDRVSAIMEDLEHHPQKYGQYLAGYQGEDLNNFLAKYVGSLGQVFVGENMEGPLQIAQCLAGKIDHLAQMSQRIYEWLPPELKQTPDTAAPLSQTSVSSGA